METAARSHRKAKRQWGHTIQANIGVDFISWTGLVPAAIILVVYFGAAQRDAPFCLHDMIAIEEQETRVYAEHSNIHFIAPAALTTVDLRKFHSSLREVLSFIKYAKDKEKRNKLIMEDGKFSVLDCKVARVMQPMANWHYS